MKADAVLAAHASGIRPNPSGCAEPPHSAPRRAAAMVSPIQGSSKSAPGTGNEESDHQRREYDHGKQFDEDLERL
jgi:hypothetical protein